MTKLGLLTTILAAAIGVGGAVAVAVSAATPMLKNAKENEEINAMIASLEGTSSSEKSVEPASSEGISDISSEASSPASQEPSEDKGTKVDHIFELEELEFSGVSQNASKSFGHLCPANSLFFNPAFGGNLCVRNVTSNTTTNTFTLKFNSSHSYFVDLQIRVASRYQNPSWPESNLASAFSLNANGKSVDLSAVTVPGSDANGKIGGNNYFNMNLVSVPLTIGAGANTLVLTPSATYLNVDYLNIRTSATLSGFTPSYFADADKAISIVKEPTTSAKGTIEIHDESCTDKVTYDLPALSDDSIYDYKDGKYSLTVLGKTYSFEG